MILKENCIFLVKFRNRELYKDGYAWVEYKAGKGRDLSKVQAAFGNNREFVHMHIYDRKGQSKSKGSKVGYLDRETIDY